MVLLVLVICTPLIVNAASWAATTCLLELFVVVSKAANPESDPSSVTLKRRAFFAPVSEFTISENVPSPLSVTVALTPLRLLRAAAKSDRLLLASVIWIDKALLSGFWVKVLPLHAPKSILIVPLLIAAVLLANPENSSVWEDASALTVIEASNAFACDWSETFTSTAVLSELTENAVDP